jgi:hypothetical protein
MPSFTIKVPNDDEGECLGEYAADYLPRVGDPFTLWHPRVCSKKDQPFCGVVSGVTHEAFNKDHPYAPLVESGERENEVTTVVWLAEEHAPPTLYCVCSEEERVMSSRSQGGECANCGHTRRT